MISVKPTLQDAYWQTTAQRFELWTPKGVDNTSIRVYRLNHSAMLSFAAETRLYIILWTTTGVDLVNSAIWYLR
ncbi:hypothetical protein PROFUN_16081 [Planoprotostelium fungivorum]|uniref:Uncharacterized protein n=1 Tax=Planoprotostelium fungivorum TaxID=1890364 RepID=A0A2P6MXD0_9EUKA|nr:hypothetical protein PROFUN_16081 [Planoprotostelium fungivorum]